MRMKKFFAAMFMMLMAFSANVAMAQQMGPIQLYFIWDQFSPMFWAMNGSDMAEKWFKNTNIGAFQTGLSIIIGRKKYYEKALFE